MFLTKYAIRDHDTIDNLLETLIVTPNNVKELDFTCVKITDKEAKLVAKFLASDNCVLTHLKFEYNALAEHKEFICIAKSMANNRSITRLDISDHIYFGKDSYLDEFIEHLATAIRDHPCLRYLSLRDNNIRMSVRSLAENMPKSLKHLDLINNDYFDATHFKFLLENTRLQTIGISCMHSIQDGNIISSIEANNSIIEFKCISHLLYNVRDDVMDAINAMLKRNRLAWSKATNVSLCLIAIRKFRRNDCGLLGWVPKDIVNIMAKQILESYVDTEWRIKEQPNKKRSSS